MVTRKKDTICGLRETQTHLGAGMQKPIDLDFPDAQAIIAIADALDAGRLNSEAPVTTARAIAAAIYGASHTRANVLAVGDLMDKLGAFGKGHGAAPHARRMADVVDAVRAHEEVARAVQQVPLVLRG